MSVSGASRFLSSFCRTSSIGEGWKLAGSRLTGVAHADNICLDTGVLAPPLLDPLPHAAILAASINHVARLSSALGNRAPGSTWFCVSPDTALAKFLVPRESSVLCGVVEDSAGATLGATSAAMHACTVIPEQPPTMEEEAIADEIWICVGAKPRQPARLRLITFISNN